MDPCQCEETSHFEWLGDHEYGIEVPKLWERVTPLGTFKICEECWNSDHMKAE